MPGRRSDFISRIAGASAAFRTEADHGIDPRLEALARIWLPTIEAHRHLAVAPMRHIGGASPLKPH